MRLDLGVYGGLLLAGLGAAYWASLPTTEGDEDKVAIVAIEPKTVAEITYKTKDLTSTAQRRDDGRFWVDYQKTETPPAPEAKPGEKAEPPPPAAEPKVTTERFLANEKVTELTASLNPLQALRVIGKVDDKQLEEFGLKDKTESLTVKTDGGKTMTFYLGKRSYGSRNRFVMEDETSGKGRVLLVDDQGFENLEKANMRMYDRRLVSFELEDVTAVAISANGKAKRMAHTQRDKDGELQWTDDEANAAAKPSYNSWMDKVGKLRLTSYATAAEEETLKTVEPFLTVALEKNGKPSDTLVFKKQDGTPATYWVYSDYLKAHGKVVANRMEPVEKDLASIMGGSAGGGH